MDMAIYGAQSIALGAYEAIHNICPQKNISCFIVTRRGINAAQILGLPVLELETYAGILSDEDKKNVEILIATPENVMQEIEKNLDEYGLFCHVRLTSKRWAELTSYKCAVDKEFLPLAALPVGYHRAGLHVYMAKFYKDTQLKSYYCIPEWITPIQVGASLCEERIANIFDCEGDNISEKNANYSELTALYWIWKNRLSNYKDTEKDKYEYYGLVHYRRILELPEDDILKIMDNDVDVVLPFPMPYEPDIEEHHKRYLKEDDWKALLIAVEEIEPEYFKVFDEILKQRYLYNYNIIIAKKGILRQYCEWLFPILERVEKLSIPKACERNDRYIGYMGETLATLYFMANKDRLNITYAGCRFLE